MVNFVSVTEPSRPNGDTVFLARARRESRSGFTDHADGRGGRSCFGSRAPLTGGTALLLVPLAIGLLGTPLAANAQPAARVYRIGFVSPTSSGPTLQAFQDGLRDLGYVEGRNLLIEAQFAEGRPERLPELIAEMIRRKVDVLVVGSTLGALAAKQATTTIPIVFAGLIDPVAPGIVASFARPGGNITGVTFGMGGEGFGGKWVELLKEAAPTVSHVAALVNSASPASAPLVPEMQTAARTLSVRLDVLDAGTLTKLDTAFAAIGTSGARGIIVTNDPFFFTNRAKLVQFAASHRLPAVYFTNTFVDVGGLMSYGSRLVESYRRAATYVHKILTGTKPAELPIERPTTFELVINLKTAKALGLTIPQSVLIRADEVIQ
jgi:putative tryptophan/tyrosine transport system substrate-binding protein